LIVLSAFTTRAFGYARWICSPSESVFHPLREVERVRDVEQHLVRQARLARGPQRLERLGAVRRIDHEIGAERGGVGERAVGRARAVLLRPLLRLLAGRAARAHPYFVSERDQLSADRRTDHPRPEHSDLHRDPPRSSSIPLPRPSGIAQWPATHATGPSGTGVTHAGHVTVRVPHASAR
jgi:hypothetical protein